MVSPHGWTQWWFPPSTKRMYPWISFREDILLHVIRPVIPETMLDAQTKYFINPTGRFCIGGPAGDSGLTGRKLIVDTYGGYARHGGGAFSGKDPPRWTEAVRTWLGIWRKM